MTVEQSIAKEFPTPPAAQLEAVLLSFGCCDWEDYVDDWACLFTDTWLGHDIERPPLPDNPTQKELEEYLASFPSDNRTLDDWDEFWARREVKGMDSPFVRIQESILRAVDDGPDDFAFKLARVLVPFIRTETARHVREVARMQEATQ